MGERLLEGDVRFFLYLIRWQLSSPLLFVCLVGLADKVGVFWSTIISNLVGGTVFYFVDKRILK